MVLVVSTYLGGHYRLSRWRSWNFSEDDLPREQFFDAADGVLCDRIYRTWLLRKGSIASQIEISPISIAMSEAVPTRLQRTTPWRKGFYTSEVRDFDVTSPQRFSAG
jgi:hypothetical protein